MKLRSVLYASVCSVLLAASAAAPAVAGAAAENPNSLAVKALDTLEKGDAKGAVLLFNEAIESRALDAETLANALLNRALAKQRLGRHHEAIGDYVAALKIDALGPRKRAVALYNRGLSWRALGKPARAIEDFTSALFYDPRFARGYYARANILHRSGQYLFALADYDKALKYGLAEAGKAHYAKAMIFDTLGRKADMREALYAALEAQPDYAPARKRLARLLKGDGVSFASIAPHKGAEGKAQTKSGTLMTAAISRIAGANTNLRKEPQAPAVAPPAALMHGPRQQAPRQHAPAEKPLMLAGAGQAAVAVAKGGAAPAPRKAAIRAVAAIKTAEAARPAKAAAPVALAVEPASAPAEKPILSAAEAKQTAARAATRKARVTYSGWAIQISSQRSEEAAWKHWKKLQGKVRRVIRDARPVVMKAEIAGRGTFYRLRLVGFGDNRKLARRLCSRLKRTRTACLVTRAGS